MYADDTQLYIFMRNGNHTVALAWKSEFVTRWYLELEFMGSWCNMLKCNPSKTENTTRLNAMITDLNRSSRFSRWKKIQQNAFSDSCIQKQRLPCKAILSCVIYRATLSQKNVTLRNWFENIFTIHPHQLHLLRTHKKCQIYLRVCSFIKISRRNAILQIGKTFWRYFAKLYHILYRSILYHI